ncbi:hypothetical protein TVAG_369960 [Trichomonas vaginalis G3]|uniref:Uncharacterized protein n=1 Tax=Trichomonas vaginalis (strain ATCC PRA-98 / G3) TaxID=412133 RepID=A2EX48_TRIV3|nr:hypothetical protein TVAGG3_0860040 [Trichomonas vaginalis G3]EAY02768.1 hypothetical protein TVAG_369960 [Trichomonas vaginalis G3]KAI5500602.1 hypothetical protein TVAGG3_0860040 [Trichomonas vaginalis G3]|eukprot:XP_001314991.1 hypothetical protein [Trichomonas vaginalis G3]
MGVYHHVETIDVDKTYCINATYYPFYLIFDEFEEGIVLNEYYSRSPNRETTRDAVFTSDNLTTFRVFELPYGSFTIKAIKSSMVSFSYISLPGYCQTGVYLSSYHSDLVQLSPSQKNFYKLGNYDDKCFIFSTESAQSFKIDQISKDQLDRVFYHTNYREFDVATGNFSKTYHYTPVATQPRPFVRLLTNRGLPPDLLKISFEAGAKTEREDSGTNIPRGRTIDCEHILTWYSEELIIMLIACCVFFGIIFVMLVSCKIMSKRQPK